MTDTPTPGAAQAPSAHRRPFASSQRTRHFRILRAVALIGRTKVDTMTACRACGLYDRDATQEVRDLCDVRRVPRRDRLGMPLIVPATLEPATGYVPPKKESGVQQKTIAELVAELREIADPLGVCAKKPPIIFKCRMCGTLFEGRYRTAKFCGGACRIAHWRAEQ